MTSNQDVIIGQGMKLISEQLQNLTEISTTSTYLADKLTECGLEDALPLLIMGQSLILSTVNDTFRRISKNMANGIPMNQEDMHEIMRQQYAFCLEDVAEVLQAIQVVDDEE